MPQDTLGMPGVGQNDVLRSITALGLRTARGAMFATTDLARDAPHPLYAGWVRSGDLVVRGISAIYRQPRIV